MRRSLVRGIPHRISRRQAARAFRLGRGTSRAAALGLGKVVRQWKGEIRFTMALTHEEIPIWPALARDRDAAPEPVPPRPVDHHQRLKLTITKPDQLERLTA